MKVFHKRSFMRQFSSSHAALQIASEYVMADNGAAY